MQAPPLVKLYWLCGSPHSTSTTRFFESWNFLDFNFHKQHRCMLRPSGKASVIQGTNGEVFHQWKSINHGYGLPPHAFDVLTSIPGEDHDNPRWIYCGTYRESNIPLPPLTLIEYDKLNELVRDTFGLKFLRSAIYQCISFLPTCISQQKDYLLSTALGPASDRKGKDFEDPFKYGLVQASRILLQCVAYDWNLHNILKLEPPETTTVDNKRKREPTKQNAGTKADVSQKKAKKTQHKR